VSETKAGPSFKLSVAIIVIGLLIGVPSTVKLVSPFVGAVSDVVTSPIMATPGERHLTLKSGDYTIFERTGTRRGFGGISVSNAGRVTLRETDVVVIGPDESPVTTRTLYPDATTTRGTTIYTAAVGFHADRAGSYDIRVTQAGAGEVTVSRTTFDGLRRAGRWLALTTSAVLLLLLGFILLIVGSVRRGRTTSAAPASGAWGTQPGGYAPAPAAAPPNWYPDPDGVSRLRYWDGTQWTEHRA
jgi:hypothetical protein